MDANPMTQADRGHSTTYKHAQTPCGRLVAPQILDDAAGIAAGGTTQALMARAMAAILCR
jgi:hypothetical protein